MLTAARFSHTYNLETAPPILGFSSPFNARIQMTNKIMIVSCRSDGKLETELITPNQHGLFTCDAEGKLRDTAVIVEKYSTYPH